MLLVMKGSDIDEVNRYYAQTYLERLGVEAQYHKGSSESYTVDVAGLAESLEVSTLILGGYENTSILDRVFSQSIDGILAQVTIPVMICQ